MPIESFASQNCSVARPLAVLGERWTILVLREVFMGSRRFDEIQDELGVASNVLSQRLATLVDEGILERRRYSEHTERFEYRPTQKGRELLPVVLVLLRWGDRHTTGRAGPPLELVHTKCDHAFHAVSTCSHCGEEVVYGEVEPRPGPGATKKQGERYDRLAERREQSRRRRAA